MVNGLRGIAIFGVISYHIIAGMFTRQSLPPGASVLLANGWSGVNLFFILSGFVLFLPYAAGDRTLTGPGDRLDFYRRRAWRLLPLFYAGVLGSWALAVTMLGMPVNSGQLVSVLSFAFVFDARSFGPAFNVPLWSIGDEVAFSVLFPLLVLGFRRHGAVRMVAAAAIVALAMRIAGIWHFPALQVPTFNGDMFACRIDEFVLGMALAWAYLMGWLPRRPGLWMAGGVALILIAWTGFDLVLREVLPPLCRAGLNDVLDAGFAVIVLAALAPRSSLGAALSWRPLQVAGMMCYSLYIWHTPLLALVAVDRARMSAPLLAASLASFLGLTFAVAALSYRYIEFGRIQDWRRLFLLAPATKTFRRRPAALPKGSG